MGGVIGLSEGEGASLGAGLGPRCVGTLARGQMASISGSLASRTKPMTSTNVV